MICPPGPPCGPIFSNEKVEGLLQVVKPEIQTLKEKLNMVSRWRWARWRSITRVLWMISGFFCFWFFFCRCPCGCNSRSRKLKMVTTLGWPCRLVPAERVWFWRVFDRLCQFYVFLCRSGKSVWTPDQHAHQDRSVPNPDFKVGVFVWVNASPSCFCSRNTETWITSSLSSSPLVFVRYYNERGDAVAKAAKQPHVVSLLFSRSQF